MPQITSITLTQGDDTTTFDLDPSRRNGDTVWFKNSTLSQTSAGQPEALLSFSEASPQRKTDKITVKYSLPKEHAVDGVYVVDDIARFDGTFRIPETFDATDRDNFMTNVESLVGAAIVKAMGENAQGLY